MRKLSVAAGSACWVWAAGLLACAAETVVVSPQGSDKGNGSAEAPYATLARALKRVKPGDTVVLRGGTYPASRVNATLSGTADAPITIRAWPKETPVLDGKDAKFDTWDSVIGLHKSNHVVLEGLEVCHGPRGISLGECTHVTVRNCAVHDVQSRALGGSGDHLTFEGNKIWSACLMNENNGQISRGQRGGWPAAVQTWKRDDHSATTNAVFRNNEVRECWGEGIDAFFCDGGVIEGNTVRDCYSVLIYNDTARNIRIDRNYLLVSTDKFDRSDTKRSATGILISMEKYDFQVPPITDEDYVISNNLIVGTGSGISYWHDAGNKKPVNSYRNITVCHNVVKDTKGDPLRFDAVPAANNAPAGCVARNNIFFKGSGGGGLSLGNPAAWTLSHNCWPNGVPAAAKEPNSFAADPQFLAAAGGGPEGFKLSPASPCLGKALPLENVAADFWGTPRRKTQPCIGLHEWMPPGSEPEKPGKTPPRRPAIP